MNYPLMLLSVCGCIDMHFLLIDIYDLLIFFKLLIFIIMPIFTYALYTYVYVYIYIYELIGDIFIWHF